jgi:hypothetical protein
MGESEVAEWEWLRKVERWRLRLSDVSFNWGDC